VRDLPSLPARWVALLALGFAVAGVLLTLRQFDSVVLPRAELALLDARFQIRGAAKPPSDVVIVAFDEKAQAAIGRFPIPRSVQARLLDAIATQRPRLVVEDFDFEQPSANPNVDNALILALWRAAPVVVATGAVDSHGRSPALGGPDGQAAARATPALSGFATSPGGVFRRVRHDVEGLPTTAVAAARLLGHPATAAAFPKGGLGSTMSARRGRSRPSPRPTS
jgi:CHASE2 domain-containing sensor protein